MPKVDYNRQPFRLCRWNRIQYGLEDTYWCEYGEDTVDSGKCMKCFLNNWFNVCSTCKKEILKTELIFVFLPEFRTGHICNDCYNGEEKVGNEPSETEKSIFFDIKNWQKLNGMKV